MDSWWVSLPTAHLHGKVSRLFCKWRTRKISKWVSTDGCQVQILWKRARGKRTCNANWMPSQSILPTAPHTCVSMESLRIGLTFTVADDPDGADAIFG